MRAIEYIRQKIEFEVFDYTQLMSLLRNYKKPKDAISLMIQKGEILRIRKGLYIFGDLWRRQVVSREVLANLIYGPSFISLEYALSFYGLIPEHVETITSITAGRSRSFDTPVGRFSYTQFSRKRISFGNILKTDRSGNWFMAEPLKVLADKIWADKRFYPTSPASFSDYLFDDLRLDESVLNTLFNQDRMNEIQNLYNTRKIDWLAAFLTKRFG